MHDQPACPFCNQDESGVILANDHAKAIHDGFPIAPDHTLVIPKRHIASLFEATREEQTAPDKDEGQGYTFHKGTFAGFDLLTFFSLGVWSGRDPGVVMLDI